MTDARAELLDFSTPPESIMAQRDDLGRWYKGDHFNVLPSKSEMRRDGLATALHGWKPAAPIIHAETRVFAMGSCFAAYFIRWLADQGFNREVASPYGAITKGAFPFENVAVVAQQFRWAFEGLDGRELLWVDPEKQLVKATEERRLSTRFAIENAEVLIVTLGLSEVWYDRVTGEPLWRAVPIRYFDPERHSFRVISVAETIEQLELIERIRAKYVPNLKIVYTVSPVRLKATFRPISTLTANSVSKAIIRAGLDEFLRGRWKQVGRDYFYFPSYEIVTDTYRDAFEEDARHPHETVVGQVLRIFARHYTSLSVDEVRTLDESLDGTDRIAQSRIEELEVRAAELQRICDERLEVIQGLAEAAQERLDLINRLDSQCYELQKRLTLHGLQD
ncbi:MAG: GSCFA domain-containing protein [Chloroflexi bacterium]|nr:GSCFA domain-containing protein [Chloroflexota bacterium]